MERKRQQEEEEYARADQEKIDRETMLRETKAAAAQ